MYEEEMDKKDLAVQVAILRITMIFPKVLLRNRPDVLHIVTHRKPADDGQCTLVPNQLGAS